MQTDLECQIKVLRYGPTLRHAFGKSGCLQNRVSEYHRFRRAAAHMAAKAVPSNTNVAPASGTLWEVNLTRP